MKDKKEETNFEFIVANATKNKVNILQRRITDLEKLEKTLKEIHLAEIEKISNTFNLELNKQKTKLVECENFITELLSYKEGSEKEIQRLVKDAIPEKLRNIDAEMLG